MIIRLQAIYSKHRFTNHIILPSDGVICVWNLTRTVFSKEGERMH